MSSRFLAPCLLLFLLVYAEITYSKVHYIRPSLDSPCPQNVSSCLTLSQFSTNFTGTDIETDNTSLFFLPGNHSLIEELYLAHGHNFSMSKYEQIVFVECTSQLGRFVISDAMSVSIKGLNFIGCGSNEVSHVTWLTIADSIFERAENKSTVLVFNDIVNANIVRSFFLSNSLEHYINTSRNYSSFDDNELLDYVYYQVIFTGPGVVYIAFSNVSIVSCRFMYNEVDIGGTLVAYNSNLHIDCSSFSNNRAYLGGVLVTLGSVINIDDSNFSQNSAENSGGVMASCNDRFSIISTNFTQNSASKLGGVMVIFEGSSFNINSSVFKCNNASYGGVIGAHSYSSVPSFLGDITTNLSYSGIVAMGKNSSFTINNTLFVNNTAFNSSFTINKSTFTYNSAESNGVGGVIYSEDHTTFTISNSMFTSNRADLSGGVIYSEDHASFTISNSMFTSNGARHENGGVIYSKDHTSFTISNSMFTSNGAWHENGGVIYSKDHTFFTISNSMFSSNRAYWSGGVIYSEYHTSFTISNSMFTSNGVHWSGGVICSKDHTSFTISNSNMDSSEAAWGGVIIIDNWASSIISNSSFDLNWGGTGGVIQNEDHGSFTISNSSFTSNRAMFAGGVINSRSYSSFNISNSEFNYNHAWKGGVAFTSAGYFTYISDFVFIKSSFTISNSSFTSNSAYWGGVIHYTVVAPKYSSFTISNSIFTSNNASYSGGVMQKMYEPSSFNFSIYDSKRTTHDINVILNDAIRNLGYSSLTISNCTFNSNWANSGRVMKVFGGELSIYNSFFSLNTVNKHGQGMIFLSQCSTHIANTTFNHNVGSIYAFSSNLNFSGYLNFNNFTEVHIVGNESIGQEGGVITTFLSTVTFAKQSRAIFFNNQAREGGAILAIESTITIYGIAIIMKNYHNNITITKSSGGGIYLKQSHIDVKGRLYLVNNSAVRGGGIYASSSTISIHTITPEIVDYPFLEQTLGILGLANNNAELGGGLYLEVDSKLRIIKLTNFYILRSSLHFYNNHADYGGAVFVADDTNSGKCSPDNECFIQILAIYYNDHQIFEHINITNIRFSMNTAAKQGSNLFGGLLDRCIPSPFNEVYLKKKIHYSGVTYLQNISNNASLDSISSLPIGLCFCNSEHKPDCSYKPPTIRVKKGEAFNVSLVAVNQVNESIDANVTASISLQGGGLGEGQQIQSIGKECKDLSYTVFSPHESETINFYADGPCGNAALSTSHRTIQFKNCTCPVGFEPLSDSKSSTKCECICDSKLLPYIAENSCNSAISSVFRVGTNSWIAYIYDTDSPGFVKYSNCPFDYCKPLTENVSINFNLPNGADTQCAYNRTGVLCGSCGTKLSLSLASSHCFPCHSHWPAVFILIFLAFMIAGVLLVTALLALNITASVGLINGFIFYANIVSAGNAAFFPSSEPSFPSVFVAWINLDIGIDVCFIDGLDAYIKTWLQLAFPIYIITLVVIVIKVSEHSPRFVRLIGRRDPISTLATLILLSYAKLLSVTISALSYATLDYHDGKRETVWLPDGNVKYFQGKHIPLVLVALLIVLIGLPYTILLFLWQWIVRASKWKYFNWTRNTRLYTFLETYHIPYKSEYRFWTGLLLVVRVALYVTASVTVSSSPQTYPLISGILIGGLILFKGMFDFRIYKKSFVHVINTLLFINLLALVLFSQFEFKRNPKKQTVVAYTSTIVTLILFIASICYHVSLLIKKKKLPEDLNEYLLTPLATNEVPCAITYSFVDAPKRDQNQQAINENERENN